MRQQTMTLRLLQPLPSALLTGPLKWRRPMSWPFSRRPHFVPKSQRQIFWQRCSGQPDRHRSLFPDNYHTSLRDGQAFQTSRSSMPIGRIPGSQYNTRYDGQKCTFDLTLWILITSVNPQMAAVFSCGNDADDASCTNVLSPDNVTGDRASS